MHYLIKTTSGFTYSFDGHNAKLFENQSQIIVREKIGTETIFIKQNVIYVSKEVDEEDVKHENI